MPIPSAPIVHRHPALDTDSLIPYINIGTTIALCTMPLGAGISPSPPTFIFDKRYRQFFGEFFLTGGLMLAGILAGALFCGFPAIVILISWSLAPMLVLDKGCNASEALTLSNKYTYGNKFLDMPAGQGKTGQSGGHGQSAGQFHPGVFPG